MFRRLAVAALAAVAMLAVLLPGAALAMGRDRNHDRLPDRWERAHGLSLKVKQGRHDQDHDGLRNAAEYRFHTNPRDADSDDDGVRDGDEHAGTVKAFDGTLLTLSLARGGTLAAEVVPGVTEVKCEDGVAHASALADDDPAHGHGADDPAGDDRGTAGHGADDPAGDDHGAADRGCAAAALMVGTRVEQAEVRTLDGRAVFTEIELR